MLAKLYSCVRHASYVFLDDSILAVSESIFRVFSLSSAERDSLCSFIMSKFF